MPGSSPARWLGAKEAVFAQGTAKLPEWLEMWGSPPHRHRDKALSKEKAPTQMPLGDPPNTSRRV